jgi:hypothetical protein
VQVDAGRNDGVDRVEQVVAEFDVGAGEVDHTPAPPGRR